MIRRIPLASRIWLGVFAVWGVLLTGVGSPGLIQARNLKTLLESRKDELAKLELDVERLDGEASRLESSRTAQEREIRRVLGYAAPDDLIFDFDAERQFFVEN